MDTKMRKTSGDNKRIKKKLNKKNFVSVYFGTNLQNVIFYTETFLNYISLYFVCLSLFV